MISDLVRKFRYASPRKTMQLDLRHGMESGWREIIMLSEDGRSMRAKWVRKEKAPKTVVRCETSTWGYGASVC